MANAEQLIMSNKKGVHTLVMACHHYGVQDVVICPGSRNAPFTISFNRSKLFRCHSIADERVAAFYALGIGLATSKPVVVVCTSGSAGINLGPALAEAFYLKVPIIAITGDRPLAWVDQGNGQTIRQEGLFENYSRGAYTVIENPGNADEAWHNRRKISELFNKVIHDVPGPLHFNVPLREPLYLTESYPLSSTPKFYNRAKRSRRLEESVIATCKSEFQKVKKVMVLVGQIRQNAANIAAIARIAALPNTVVLTETTSNIEAMGVISTIDRLIMSIDDVEVLKQFMPDMLITLGGMVVSKKIKALLREHSPSVHWHINPHDEGLDTYRSMTTEIPCEPAVFIDALLHGADAPQTSDYSAIWKRINALGIDAHLSYMPTMPWSDFKAFEILMDTLPAPLVLHMANSSPVRYVQLFGAKEGITYHANRGTSGIDGSTSTAAGWAKAHPESDVLLITGDMAFMYDSNGLWNKALPQNLKIIVVNNGGGGIFRIIEGPDSTEELEHFFEAHHPVALEHIASAFGLQHYLATNTKELASQLPQFFGHKGCAILEVCTPSSKNASVLKKYFKHIAAHFSREGICERTAENQS